LLADGFLPGAVCITEKVARYTPRQGKRDLETGRPKGRERSWSGTDSLSPAACLARAGLGIRLG